MIRPVLFSFLIRFSAAILNFLVVVLLSNALGPLGKGICSKYITIIANALIFCDFIGGPPLVYLSAKYRVSSVLIPSYLWSLLTSTITIIIFFYFGQFPSEEIIVMIILSFLNSCIAIHQNILSGKLKFYQLNVVILLQSLTLFFSLKYLLDSSEDYLELSASPIHYLIALGFSYGIATMTGFLFVINLEKTGRPIRIANFLKEALRYGFINISGHGLQFINQRLSYYLLNAQTLGVFSNVSSIGESLWLIPNSLATVQYGKISNISEEKKANEITLLFLKVNLMLCAISAFIMLFIPDDFYIFLFGVDFSGISDALIFLIPGLFLFSGYLIIGHHFSGRGNFILNLKSILAGLIITILGFVILLFINVELNAVNVAVVTTLSYSGNFIYAFYVFYKNSNFGLSDFVIKREELISLAKGLLKNKKFIDQIKNEQV